MAIEFDCPTCRTRIRTPDEAAGKKARCPTCQSIVPIPLASSAGPATGSFGALATAPAPLPSASGSPPTANPFNHPSAPQPPSLTPMPWLPPADAFAPKGPPEFGGPGSHAGYAPPSPSSNPFSDGMGGAPSGPVNPYASPGGYGSMDVYALSREEIRGKLLGPAIGLALGAILGMLCVAWLGVALMLDDEFHRDLQAGGDPAATFFAYLIFAILGFVFTVPSIVSLVGAWAMFRGRGVVAAWSGAIAMLLPCSPCWIPFAAFSIWGMVVLNDPRVQQGMK